MNVQTPPAGWWRLDAEQETADKDGKKSEEEEVAAKTEGDDKEKEREETEAEAEEEEVAATEESADSGAKEIRKMELHIGKKVAFILYNVLSPAECRHLVAKTEEMGYKPMPEYPTSYRSNTRLIIDDEELQEEIWRRVQPHIPAEFEDRRGKWHPYGLNARWRFCRYLFILFIYPFLVNFLLFILLFIYAIICCVCAGIPRASTSRPTAMVPSSSASGTGVSSRSCST